MAESAVLDGGAVDMSRLIHPRVEAEIAFVLRSELGGPDCDIDDVMAATDFILPAAEIIDSRYENFEFRPEKRHRGQHLRSKICDRGCCALGFEHRPSDNSVS